MEKKVFLSHSSADKPFVRELDRALRGFGVKTFLDERDIKIGEDIPQRIYQEIDESSYMCYIISSNSINSEWVKEELSTAKMIEKERGGVFILPILIDDVELPTSVRSKRYADFRNVKHIDLSSPSFCLLLEALGIEYRGESRIWDERPAFANKILRIINIGFEKPSESEIQEAKPFEIIAGVFLFWMIFSPIFFQCVWTVINTILIPVVTLATVAIWPINFKIAINVVLLVHIVNLFIILFASALCEIYQTTTGLPSEMLLLLLAFVNVFAAIVICKFRGQ